jgi:hypothetical protein
MNIILNNNSTGLVFGVARCQTELHLMFGAKINVVGVSDFFNDHFIKNHSL